MAIISVYISGTRDDLSMYQMIVRDAVVHLGMMPVTSGEPALHGDQPLNAIETGIEKCQIFIGIYTHHPGDYLPGTSTPLIEVEYNHARQQQIPMLLFLAHPEAPYPANRVARGVAGDQIEAFRQRVMSESLYTLFNSDVDLQAKVFFGLHHVFTDLQQEHGVIQMQPIFGVPPTEPQFISDVFMIMPFAEAFHPIYTATIAPTVEALGMTIRRGDDYFSRHAIIQEIWSAIYHCKFVIAECTGRNANVAYELGIAHTLGKPGILITQTLTDIPFDLQHLRFIVYKPTPNGLAVLGSQLKHAIEWLVAHPEDGG